MKVFTCHHSERQAFVIAGISVPWNGDLWPGSSSGQSGVDLQHGKGQEVRLHIWKHRHPQTLLRRGTTHGGGETGTRICTHQPEVQRHWIPLRALWTLDARFHSCGIAFVQVRSENVDFSYKAWRRNVNITPKFFDSSLRLLHKYAKLA